MGRDTLFQLLRPLMTVAAMAAIASAQSDTVQSDTVQSDVAPADGRSQLRQRWQEMSSEEREGLRGNWQRWQELSRTDRDHLRTRHQSFLRMQRHVDRVLPDDERRRLEPLPRETRRREMARLTRERLNGFLESVPANVRQSIAEELRRLEPRERSRRFAQMIRTETNRRFAGVLEEMVQDGTVEATMAERQRSYFERAGPQERMGAIQRLASMHPDGLQVSQELLEGLGQVDDPIEAMDRVHVHRVPDLTVHDTLEMLASHGVPDVDRRRWTRLQGEQRARLLHKLMHDHEIIAPTSMARHLQQLGVPPHRVRAAFGGPRKVESLRRLYQEFGHEELDFEDYWRRSRRGRGGSSAGRPMIPPSRDDDRDRRLDADRRLDGDRRRRGDRVPPTSDRRDGRGGGRDGR